MDIKTTLAKKKGIPIKKWALLCSILILVSLSVLSFSEFSAMNVVDRDDVRIASVVKGDLDIKVQGYGKLRAKHKRFLTSLTQATVEDVYFYPGTKVTADTVIMSLSNPVLEQNLASSQLELARQKAQFKEMTINNQSQVLERESQITLLDSEYENAKLRVEAEAKLIDKGIVSSLDFKRSQLEVRQLSLRLDIEARRLLQLKQMQIERIKVQQELLKQFELNFKTASKLFNKLQVTAGIDGVIQELNIEVGQSLIPGAQLALVGSDNLLVAQLRVQQREAELIRLGLFGEINTFGGTVTAKVSRIDPVVVDGRVLIELNLIGGLPANARPDLSIEGHINIKTLKNILYIEQPSGINQNDEKQIYKLSKDLQNAQITQVKFGSISGNMIEVISGANNTDTFVISDTSNFEQLKTLTINN